MQKVILYYTFTPLADPQAVRLWQKTLADSLSLKGRIIIAPHGINGTLGGELEDLKRYVKATKEYAAFKNIVFKWSEGDPLAFPRLSVKVRAELVAFKAGAELKVDENGVVGGGNHLKPEEVQDLVARRAGDVVFFDGRNAHEAAIGKFKDAVVPATATTRDFIPELESGKYDSLKNKAVITYCTGGIRCEVLTMLMKNRGFQEVYQTDGGIVTYGEAYGDEGLWEGALRVFDNRMITTFSERAKTIGTCIHCGEPSSNYENCLTASCNQLVLMCHTCKDNPRLRYHSDACRQQAVSGRLA